MPKEWLLERLGEEIEKNYKEYCKSCSDESIMYSNNASLVVKRSNIKRKVLNMILIKELLEHCPDDYVMDNSDAELAFDTLVRDK